MAHSTRTDEHPEVPWPKPPFRIILNGKIYDIQEYVRTGLQLKELAKKEPDCLLYLEWRPGERILIPNDGEVALSNGLRFYTIRAEEDY